jgi:hypothetical protein
MLKSIQVDWVCIVQRKVDNQSNDYSMKEEMRTKFIVRHPHSAGASD